MKTGNHQTMQLCLCYGLGAIDIRIESSSCFVQLANLVSLIVCVTVIESRLNFSCDHVSVTDNAYMTLRFPVRKLQETKMTLQA